MNGIDLHSVSALRAAFRAAAEPSLDAVVGDFRAQFLGPAWMRAAGAPTMAAGRMRGWCGKRFTPDVDGDGVVAGFNRVLRGGEVHDSVPMTAALGPARLDGSPAIVISYPSDAPFPWTRVRDEFREIEDGVLLGMTFGIPLAPPGGTPFLLRRV